MKTTQDKYIVVTKNHVFSSIMFECPICCCIQIEAHVAVCKDQEISQAKHAIQHTNWS